MTWWCILVFKFWCVAFILDSVSWLQKWTRPCLPQFQFAPTHKKDLLHHLCYCALACSLRSAPPWPGPCPLSVCCHWVHRVRVNKEQDAASVRLWETHWVTSVSVILSCISHSCARAAIMQYVVWCCCWPRVKLRLKVTSITIVVFSWCPAQPGGTESWWG